MDESKFSDMEQMYVNWMLYFCFMENIFTDEYFMKKALNEAEIAFERGDSRSRHRY
jgi:hypothetical protein